jgi:hypothetical protein
MRWKNAWIPAFAGMTEKGMTKREGAWVTDRGRMTDRGGAGNDGGKENDRQRGMTYYCVILDLIQDP